jgi:hypothetical protein
MKITIELDSLEELEDLTTRILVGGTGVNLRDSKPVKEPEPAPAPKKAPAKKAEPKPVEDPEQPFKEAEPAPTATEIINKAEAKIEADESAVKLLLADKIKGGKKAEVRALFEEYGVSKLSELISKHPDKLQEIAVKAEAL